MPLSGTSSAVLLQPAMARVIRARLCAVPAHRCSQTPSPSASALARFPAKSGIASRFPAKSGIGAGIPEIFPMIPANFKIGIQIRENLIFLQRPEPGAVHTASGRPRLVRFVFGVRGCERRLIVQ